MKSHVFRPSRYYSTLGGHGPVLAVHPGDSIETSTVDAHGNDEHEQHVADGPNPLTGPFEISGAEPGDCLAVEIEELVPNRTTCWTRRYIAPHVFEPELFSERPELVSQSPSAPEYIDWRIDFEHNCVRPSGPIPDPDLFPAIQLCPMLGCLGTAPAEGQAISTTTSGRHGGNMDYLGIRQGATLYFPVSVNGAMFYLGDGHATQGHGEIGGTGTEVSMRVRFTVRLLKGRSIGWPRGEDEAYIFSLGNARPLDEALQHATTEMFRWLIEEHGLDTTRASLLMAQAVEYEVGNVFDPAFTVVCKIQKRYLPDS